MKSKIDISKDDLQALVDKIAKQFKLPTNRLDAIHKNEPEYIRLSYSRHHRKYLVEMIDTITDVAKPANQIAFKFEMLPALRMYDFLKGMVCVVENYYTYVLHVN